MSNLEDRPDHFMLLLALMRRIFGVLHLVLELQKGIFDVFEAVWRRLLVASTGASGRHDGIGVPEIRKEAVLSWRKP